MKKIIGIVAAACVLTSLGTSMVSATPRTTGVDTGLPMLEQIATKMNAKQRVEAEALRGKVDRAFQKLQSDKAFLEAVGRRDEKTVAKMLRETSGVNDTSMAIKFNGGSGETPTKIRWEITIRCCPFGISVRII